MQALKNILVVYGDRAGDKAALRDAVELSKRNDARLEVVEFVVALRRRWWRLATGRSQDTETPDAGQIQEQLARSIEPVRQQGIQVKAMALAGTPFEEVIREVLREQHDLLIIAAEDKAGTEKSLPRGTAMQLLTKCPCPVWMTRPDARTGRGHILAALDPDSSDAARHALNVSIMNLATSIARREGSTLHIVHAWDLTGRSLDKSRSEMSKEALDELLRENEEAHQRQLDQILQGFPLDGVDHRIHLQRGKSETVILELAEREQVDLIVMGTVGRTGFRRFVIGNTAEWILRRAECSVLTVKPEGFVTPVQL